MWYVHHHGTLVVDAPVTGRNDWFAVQNLSFDGPSLATIRIDVTATDLGGKVEIVAGRLEVNESFCAQGDLILQNLSRFPATIVVAEGKSASFARTCQ